MAFELRSEWWGGIVKKWGLRVDYFQQWLICCGKQMADI